MDTDKLHVHTRIITVVMLKVLPILLISCFFCVGFRADIKRQYRQEILLTPNSPPGQKYYNALLILNYKGDTVKHIRIDGVFVEDFQRWNNNGDLRYSYFLEDGRAYQMKGMSCHFGNFIITDSNLKEIKRIGLLPYKDINTEKHNTLDGHEMIYFNDRHYITMAYFEKNVHNIPAHCNPSPLITVAVPIIQEVIDDKVIWQWDGSEHPELYDNSVENFNFSDTSKTQDYLHANAMTIDPSDSNLVLSCRNSDQVIKIDRSTGAILWKLGGKNSDFALTADQKFIRQHHITFTEDSSLLIFDNGDMNIRPCTRILEIKLDEINKKISSYKAFEIPAKFTAYTGSVQKFGDSYFIGGGTGSYVMEINTKTGKVSFQKKLPFSTYRALKY